MYLRVGLLGGWAAFFLATTFTVVVSNPGSEHKTFEAYFPLAIFIANYDLVANLPTQTLHYYTSPLLLKVRRKSGGYQHETESSQSYGY
jgi:hypothetical protein